MDTAAFVSEAELHSFSTNGFLAMKGISPPSELSEIRRILADLISRRVGEKEGCLFDTMEGWRHQVIPTDSSFGDGPLTWIEARHQAHARVEDRIRTGKDSGFGRFPSREYAINQAWLKLALTGIDLTCWMRMLLLDGALALAEPKKLRYRLLHVAARITRSARRTRLRIAEHWPWVKQLATAFERLAALPRPLAC